MLPILIFYCSYLAFPFLFFCCYLWWKKCMRFGMIVLILLSCLFIYSRFVEPQMLLVNGPYKFTFETNTQTDDVEDSKIRIALVSDMHIGVYKSPAFLDRIIDAIEASDVDLVLIPGDFVHKIDTDVLPDAYKTFEDLEIPVYAVTGNHDTYLSSGYQTYEEIYSALTKHGINVIDNEVVDVLIKDNVLTLAGLSDLWAGDSQTGILSTLREDENVILIAHNPDFAYLIDPSMNIDLIVSGHTHGGQVRLPFVYKSAIPTEFNFDEGYYFANGFDVFVTAGAGEVGLPMRLGIPPRIDILEIDIKK